MAVAPPEDDEPLARVMRESEGAFAAAIERTVQREAFGELLAMATENVMAVTKIAFGVGDAVVRSLRLAGREDINRLARQLARTEDKLERVLQEVESLRVQRPAAVPAPESERPPTP